MSDAEKIRFTPGKSMSCLPAIERKGGSRSVQAMCARIRDEWAHAGRYAVH